MDNIYKNIEEYNPNKKCKMLEEEKQTFLLFFSRNLVLLYRKEKSKQTRASINHI